VARGRLPRRGDGSLVYGYSTTPHWMQLTRSGIGLRSIHEGFAIRSGLDEYSAKLASILASRSDVMTTDERPVVVVPKSTLNGTAIDTRDRVQLGAELLSALVEVGL
jgi:hypothetical protein